MHQKMNANGILDMLENLRGGILLCAYNATMLSAEIVYANRGWLDRMDCSLKQPQLKKNENSYQCVPFHAQSMDKRCINE